MLTQDDIKSALTAVKYPGYSRDIISFDLVKEISVANGAVSVMMQLTSPNPEAAQQIKAQINALDTQLDQVLQNRSNYLEAPLSKDDYMAAIRADLQGKSALFKAQLVRQLDQFPVKFKGIQIAATGGLNLHYLSTDGNTPIVPKAALYFYLEDAIVAGVERALEGHEWPVDAMPAAEREKALKALSSQIEAIRAEREGLVQDLIDAGVTQ